MFSLCAEAVPFGRQVVCGVESLRPALGRTKARLTNERTGNRRRGDDHETLTLSWKRSRLGETSKRDRLRNKPERQRGLLVGFFVIFVIIFMYFFPSRSSPRFANPSLEKIFPESEKF